MLGLYNWVGDLLVWDRIRIKVSIYVIGNVSPIKWTPPDGGKGARKKKGAYVSSKYTLSPINRHLVGYQYSNLVLCGLYVNSDAYTNDNILISSNGDGQQIRRRDLAPRPTPPHYGPSTQGEHKRVKVAVYVE